MKRCNLHDKSKRIKPTIKAIKNTKPAISSKQSQFRTIKTLILVADSSTVGYYMNTP